MRRLPPLTAIEAFIQVARLGSVKAAADALALSAPALSRRIQTLERHVGHPLFERRHQAIQLNPDGERLMHAIAPSVDALALAMETAVGEAGVMRLRLGVPSLFASQRLMPQLPALRALYPDLHIDLDTAARGVARLDEGLDAVVAISRDVDPNLYARQIGSDRVVAIAGRGLMEGPDAPQSPADLARCTIFLHRDLPETFDYWREAVGLPDLEPEAIDHFDAGQLILDATAAGLGVAFMLESHFNNARDPRLVKLFNLAVPSPYAYRFVCRKSALKRRPVKIFHDWLFEWMEAEERKAA